MPFIGGISQFEPQLFLVNLIILALIFFIVFGITYRLDGHFLLIKNSILGTTKIDIHSITKVEKTLNPSSAPAPSVFGRVEIYYEKNKSILISPKYFEDFVADLLKINPDIIVKR